MSFVTTLYITEQQSILRKTGNRLIVEKDDAVLLDVPCHKIDAVLIFGNVQFTTQAVHELFEHGIEMAILTRTGRLIGQITSPAGKNILLRIAQFKKYEDAAFRLNLSKTIVTAKTANATALVRQFAYNHPDRGLADEIRDLDAYAQKISTAQDTQSLLGLEGMAARTYFGAFAKMILGVFAFTGRKKRPPPDPVNAMLSFSYTILFNEISSSARRVGFDPYLGFFHSADYGRASLAADIVEEFRAPVADRLVLSLVNNRVFDQQDFHENPRGRRHLFQS